MWPVSLDRFAQGLPDRQAQPIEIAGICENEKCNELFFPGDEYLDIDGYHYCSEECALEALGARWVTAGYED